MKQTKFINQILNNQNTDINDLASFLVDYIITLEHKEESRLLQTVPVLIQGITNNVIDLGFIIKKYCEIKNITIYTLSDLKNLRSVFRNL